MRQETPLLWRDGWRRYSACGRYRFPWAQKTDKILSISILIRMAATGSRPDRLRIFGRNGLITLPRPTDWRFVCVSLSGLSIVDQRTLGVGVKWPRNRGTLRREDRRLRRSGRRPRGAFQRCMANLYGVCPMFGVYRRFPRGCAVPVP